ncbi:iron ABC transporter permease [uncultured Algimonas sp.]|uniref:FecCD family ABC transporter permease n=1 Tax=uncultured Algimonas sp. TaxID=1547920 RepID=UPI00261707B1|nr:iron ABC transporter permease [uncultured Algimonas sp.]
MAVETASSKPPLRTLALIAAEADRRRAVVLAALCLLTVVSTFLSILIGPANVDISDILGGVTATLGLSDKTTPGEAIVSAIRLPRTVLTLSVGLALGISGAALQGLFRNPLVDPQLIGVSAGGALGAATWIVFGASLPAIPLLLSSVMTAVMAFIGSLAAMAAVYTIGTRRGRVNVATMLLAGIAVNALAASGLGLMLFLSDDFQLRAITFWTLGSVGGASWAKIMPALAVMIVLPLWLVRECEALNLFGIGEDEARHLGCDTAKLKRRMVVLPAIITAAAVSVSGIIGFIGLVAPHLVRLLAGSDNRIVLPGSALLGASLLLIADIVARTVAAPAELPLGVVTSLIGAPFFIWLLSRQRAWLA